MKSTLRLIGLFDGGSRSSMYRWLSAKEVRTLKAFDSESVQQWVRLCRAAMDFIAIVDFNCTLIDKTGVVEISWAIPASANEYAVSTAGLNEAKWL